ncbi:EamA family transporter [Humibacter sp.]|uniref:EamA family transporter n=1 Tax=Humibacter sp. TaxID=1940291 RepID=UPI003F7D8F15
MGAVLGLIAALAYGASDFVAGIASRRTPVMLVTAVTLVTEFLLALVVLAFVHGAGPTPSALLWGALSGVGSAVGTLALYQGFAVGSMSIVATVSGVLTVVIPAVVGVAIGNRLTVLGLAGVLAAVVAVALVSWTGGLPFRRRTDDGRPSPSGDERRRTSGAGYGALAGASFALLFIALERSGTSSGVWPVASGQLLACLAIVPIVLIGMRRDRMPASTVLPALRLPAIAGVLGGLAAFSYLSATGLGELVIVAVLTSMYPAVTVLLARFVLGERWSRVQAAGLVLSAASVAAVALS